MARVVHSQNNTKIKYEPLLDPESSLMVFLSEPAITSITFFAGADLKKSQSWLGERLSLVCQANPWLAGRLVRDKKVHKNVLLALPQSIMKDDVSALLCEDNTKKVLSSVSIKTKYDVLCETLLKSDFVVGPGYKLIGKDLRVSKFSLVPVADGVALVVSLTHAIADGHTYYKIMSMLSGDVEKLSYVRKHDYVPKSIDAIGKAEHKFLNSTSFLICCIRAMMCGGKASLDARFVDEEKVRKWKDGVKDGFVSTNDVLTSTFAMATNADILLMAINLRNRVAEADELDAGNYELVVIHDSSASNPQNIRKSLVEGPPFKRTGNEPLPGFFKAATSKCALITNWAFPFFSADLTLRSASGEKNIPIQLHLPIYEPKNIAFPIAIIFRPCHGKLGVLYGGSPRDLTNELLMAAGAPIGDQVNKEMFPLD